MVAVTAAALTAPMEGCHSINIGSGERTTVLEVAGQVNAYFGNRSSVQVNGAFRQGDIRHGFADLTRARQLLHYQPAWSFSDGLQRFLSWAEQSSPSTEGYEQSLAEMRIGGCCMTEAKPIESGKIGVVTVTYNSEPVLEEFFDSLTAQTHKRFVLYVVDNASKDQTLEITRRRTDLSVILIANAENLGVAKGNNQGILAAVNDGCECVLLLNNDTVFHADIIAQLYAGLERQHCE